MKKKLGLFSIVLLGINAIIGSGIFLLPNKAMALMGTASLAVFIFNMFVVMSIGLCFAEAATYFNKNGGPYVYAKEAFGDFIGFEVGFIKWAICIIAWATMAVAFATALGQIVPAAQDPMIQNIVVVCILVGLGIVNIIGVNVSKILNNVVTVSKLVPMIIFIALGIFYIKPSNYSPVFIETTGNFGKTALLLFYAFTGFENISVAAEDMENPQKDLPKATVIVMIIVSLFYFFIQFVSIGILGLELAHIPAPIQTAMGMILGPFGSSLVAAGTLVSIGGINIANSFVTPRCGVALADDGLLPSFIGKRSKRDTPTYAILISVGIAIPVALSGSFATLAAISVVSRFAQYIPTCLSVLVFRKRNQPTEFDFKIPFGPVIPIFAITVSFWMLSQATLEQLLWGLAGLLIAVPFYFIMKKNRQDQIKI
ncbi:APC family permease [Erysipelothrix rhusiopathiae]|nr:APC family permease [Erysipelothrix rhusiopathiae]MDE9424208.1 APC family permease [Erysipelothrix rhusiopathiae]MDE9425831.1 APC family permease [Erysipelothrix rhusiopathiae]